MRLKRANSTHTLPSRTFSVVFFSWLGGDGDCLQLCFGMLFKRWELWLWAEWMRTWHSRKHRRLGFVLFHFIYFEARACCCGCFFFSPPEDVAWGKVWARSSAKTPRARLSAPRVCRSAWTRSWLARKRLATAPGARRSSTGRLLQTTASRLHPSSRRHQIATRRSGPSPRAHHSHVGLRTT